MSRTIATPAAFLVSGFRIMLKKLALLVAMFTFSTLAFAQQNQQQEASDAPGTDTCSFVYSSGPSATFTRYCLTVNGNIVQFDSPAGFEYIKVQVVGEGYGVCDFDGGPKAYYDYAGSGESGNWNATVVSVPNATTRKFVRTTNDGVWQLTQTIKQIKASAKGPGSISITMALKNLTAIPRDANILRYADVDANATPGDDEFDFTLNSAFGSEPGFSLGLGLTGNTFTLSHEGFTQSTPFGPDPCHIGAKINFAPFVGDGSLGHLWALASVPPGGTKTVAMTYKPI